VDTADDSLAKLFEQLRTGTSRGREEAFRQLFERLYPRLYHYFSKRGFPPEDAQDLTQETLLGIYRSMGSLRNEKRFEPWLFQIARNAYLLSFRRKSAEMRSGIEVPIEVVENQTSSALNRDSPLEQALEQECRQLLHEAIQELPKQMRDCMTLRIDGHLSYAEIARVLDLSVETVKAHLYQGRRRLQQKLGAYFQAHLEEGP
jgi:RNA polymerase sigma-70 factor (ECF subfamily)